MKKILSIALIATFCVVSTPTSAEAIAPSITAPSIVLLEPGTRRILYSKSPYRKQEAASTTKIVTALVVIDQLQLNDWVRISSAVESVEPTKLYLKGGDELRVVDLLHAILIKSANDAAAALAIEVAGSERKFAEMMNERVRSIGAKSTKFINASGLPGTGQYSTAYDLALIMDEALKNKTLVSILNKREAVIRTKLGKRYFLKSHNKMLWNKNDVIGKTGWTRKSRYCFLGFITGGQKDAIISMLGSNKLWPDVKSLTNTFLRMIGAHKSVLSYGDRGDDVKKLQYALKKAGYFDVTPTGYFGTITRASTRRFQKAKTLQVDGIVGSKTKKALTPYY